ncbi:MAG: hypothetical protein ACPGR8_12945 [Limisphaerales bacterium]
MCDILRESGFDPSNPQQHHFVAECRKRMADLSPADIMDTITIFPSMKSKEEELFCRIKGGQGGDTRFPEGGRHLATIPARLVASKANQAPYTTANYYEGISEVEMVEPTKLYVPGRKTLARNSRGEPLIARRRSRGFLIGIEVPKDQPAVPPDLLPAPDCIPLVMPTKPVTGKQQTWARVEFNSKDLPDYCPPEGSTHAELLGQAELGEDGPPEVLIELLVPLWIDQYTDLSRKRKKRKGDSGPGKGGASGPGRGADTRTGGARVGGTNSGQGGGDDAGSGPGDTGAAAGATGGPGEAPPEDEPRAQVVAIRTCGVRLANGRTTSPVYLYQTIQGNTVPRKKKIILAPNTRCEVRAAMMLISRAESSEQIHFDKGFSISETDGSFMEALRNEALLEKLAEERAPTDPGGEGGPLTETEFPRPRKRAKRAVSAADF